MNELFKEEKNLFLSKKTSYGYIYYLQVELGRGLALSCYQHPLSMIDADEPIKERFKESIREYFFGRKPEGPKPLDYTYVALLQFGLRSFAGEPIATKSLYRVGYKWWSGSPDIDPDENTLSIKNLLMKDFSSYQAMHATQRVQSLIALHRDIVLLIMRKMEIPYTIQDHNEGYELTITTCPFCCNLYSDCPVFAGVIDSMTVWFKETIAHDAQDQTIIVTHNYERQHRIAVTLTQGK
ncbi:hypothetical protein F8S13_21455 [Chloroflexia bacterium SDU3-3]|nr:hypothetical protein F8S13_21455 [Chloroflexia bacterium SDU3-3]